MYFFHLLLDCNLLEMNISYGFGNINFTTPIAYGAVDHNLKDRSPPAVLNFTLYFESSHTIIN